MLLTLATLALTGCRVSGELENQAYVLVLGMDRSAGGGLMLTAKVPQIGKSGDQDGDSGGYLTFSAGGEGWPEALEALEQATPRKMNLSHIEMIVASETLAREADFDALVTRVSETPHLYTTARFAVCVGQARDFIDGLETVIGSRLSSEIDAMLDHYAEQGCVPRASFADAYYALKSIYGDPVAIRGRTVGDSETTAAMAVPADGPETEASPMKQRYLGAALFSRGRMAGALDAEQTAFMCLIRGERIALPVSCDGERYALTPEGAAKRSVAIDEGRVTLRVSLAFSALDDLCAADARTLEAVIEEKATGVIRTCQALQADPFGFAEAAAAHFLTIGDWMRFDWRSRYQTAGIEVEVRIRESEGG